MEIKMPQSGLSVRTWQTAAVLCWVSVTVLSLLPGEDLPATSLSDKQEHFIAYASITLLYSLGWRNIAPWRWAIAAGCYGVLIELAQNLTTRTPDVLDAVANSLGASIGLLLVVSLNWIGLLKPERN